MYHDESQPEHHLERANLGRPNQPFLLPSPDEEVQRKRMLIALGILLLALVAVIVRDWDFWFPARGERAETVAGRRSRNVAPEKPVSAPATAAKHESKSAKIAAPATGEVPFTATTERAVLPALQVEVVAGNRRLNVPAKSSAIHVDMGAATEAPGAGAVSSRAAAPSVSAGAGEHAQTSPQTAQNVSVSVPPDYPLLARQMKVQGAVSLQALIARDGTIQRLEILSGPAILAAAAREAVKQWHFKPYLQNGQPVETQARITVNFTISTN
jgi:TonB family protein